jgi:hypothetical protein
MSPRPSEKYFRSRAASWPGAYQGPDRAASVQGPQRARPTQHLPEFISSMLAKPGAPFDSNGHLFPIKWDGTGPCRIALVPAAVPPRSRRQQTTSHSGAVLADTSARRITGYRRRQPLLHAPASGRGSPEPPKGGKENSQE